MSAYCQVLRAAGAMQAIRPVTGHFSPFVEGWRWLRVVLPRSRRCPWDEAAGARSTALGFFFVIARRKQAVEGRSQAGSGVIRRLRSAPGL
jgi:hypothetical protein